jgi:hypothetical protein
MVLGGDGPRIEEAIDVLLLLTGVIDVAEVDDVGVTAGRFGLGEHGADPVAHIERARQARAPVADEDQARRIGECGWCGGLWVEWDSAVQGAVDHREHCLDPPRIAQDLVLRDLEAAPHAPAVGGERQRHVCDVLIGDVRLDTAPAVIQQFSAMDGEALSREGVERALDDACNRTPRHVGEFVLRWRWAAEGLHGRDIDLRCPLGDERLAQRLGEHVEIVRLDRGCAPAATVAMLGGSALGVLGGRFHEFQDQIAVQHLRQHLA